MTEVGEKETKETIQAKRHRLSSVPRACEACKIRKIRCDRSNPCSNCQSAGIACQKTNARPESRPKSDRVTAQLDVSQTQWETQWQTQWPAMKEHIEHLEKRLYVVERQLTSQSIAPEHPRTLPLSDGIAAQNEPCLSPLAGTTTLYEGGSSFTNQSIQASEIAQKTINSESAGEGSGLNASFSYLKTLLRPSTTFSSLEDHQFSRIPASRFVVTMVPLPLKLVLAILQEIKSMHCSSGVGRKGGKETSSSTVIP